MADKPILFSGPMVRAILAGEKTNTRRLYKLPKGMIWYDALGGEQEGWYCSEDHENNGWWHVEEDRAPVAVGDTLLPALAIPSLGDRYCADTFGNIWSLCSGRWRRLKGAKSSKGYLTVTPARHRQYKTQLVHALVAEAFYGHRPGMQVRHLDGDQLNNAPENLDWGTQQQNWSDRACHGRGMGEHHHNNKLTTLDVSTIRESLLSQRKLAKQYGVSQNAIWCIRNGVTWRKDRDPYPPNMPRWASRITLKVTGVRIEHLQDMNRGDAMAEGCPFPNMAKGPNPMVWFAQLWDEINGKGSWDADPWVWVYDFKREQQG